MPLDPSTVKNIATLARIELNPDQLNHYVKDLSRILNLVEQMNQVDTDGIEPLAHPQDRHLRLRADEVTESNQRELFQHSAPATVDGLYLVPKVLG